MKNRLNPELGHLLYIVNSYPQLRDTVENIMHEVHHHYYTNSYLQDFEPGSCGFIAVIFVLQMCLNYKSRQVSTYTKGRKWL